MDNKIHSRLHFSRGKVGRQDSWGYDLSHDVCGSVVISPRITTEFEGIFIFLVVIMVHKPDCGIFSETIVEIFEEISFAKALESLAIMIAASSKEVQRRVIGSSSSSNSSDGEDISDSLILMVLCMYMFNHS